VTHDGPPPPPWGAGHPPPSLGLEGLFADPPEPPADPYAAPSNPYAGAAGTGAGSPSGPVADAAYAAAAADAAARRKAAHRARRGPARYVLPAVLGAVVLVALGVGVAGWLGSGPSTTTTSPGSGGAPAFTARSTASDVSPGGTAASTGSPSVSGRPSPSPSASTAGSPSAQPSTPPAPPARPTSTAPARPPVVHAPLVVLNETRQTGLAAEVAQRLRAKGWTVTGVGNWRGSVPATTVYYPAGMLAAARALAYDLGVDRIRPRVPGMLGNRLTVVLHDDPFSP
jgi:hypothetical protein